MTIQDISLRKLSGSKAGSSKITNTSDNLFSTDVVEVLLGISEGPIEGLKDGAKSFLIGTTALKDPTGHSNFDNFELVNYKGSEQGEEIHSRLGGFGASTTVNTQLATHVPVVRTGTHTQIDYLDVRFAINQLVKSTEKGTFEHTGRWLIEYKKVSDSEWSLVRTNQANPLPPQISGPTFDVFYGDEGNDRNIAAAPGDRPTYVSANQPESTANAGIWFNSANNFQPMIFNGSHWYYPEGLVFANNHWTWREASSWGGDKSTTAFVGVQNPYGRAYEQGDYWVQPGLNRALYHNGSSWVVAGSTLRPGTFGENGTGGSTGIVGGEVSVTGKTTQVFAKEFRIPVARVDEPYMIRVTKTSPINTTELLFDITWESFQEVTANSYKFPALATTQLVARASEQFSSLPDFSGIYRGRIIRVPSNYNPTTRVYTGVWDGTWKLAYSNNPAYVANDLVMNDRYGMNAYYPTTLNKMDVYEAGRWCDTPTANGSPRFTYNGLVSDPRGGRDALNYMCGIFAGRFFDNGNGTGVIKIDKDDGASVVFTPENVVEGLFTYSFTEISTRHNDITVAFTNPDLNWQEDRRRVFDSDHINKYGRIPHNFIAVGCTDPAEAIRRARYHLITGIKETMMVNFRTNRMGLYLSPYDVVLVSDPDMETGLTGRVKAVSGPRKIQLRDGLHFEPGYTYRISFQVISEATNDFIIVSRELAAGTVGSLLELTTTTDLPPLPEDCVFTIEQANGTAAPQAFRVMSISEIDGDPDNVEIQAMQMYRAKWLFIDGDVGSIADLDKSLLDLRQKPQPIKNLRVSAKKRRIGQRYATTITLDWTKSDTKTVSRYKIEGSRDNGPMASLAETSVTQFEWDDIPSGEYLFQVIAIDVYGYESKPTVIEHRLIGDLNIVDEVTALRLVDGVSDTVFENRSPMFRWGRNTSEVFENYIVQICNTGGGLIRETVTEDPEYTYEFAFNLADNNGQPRRDIMIRVASRDQFGFVSSFEELVVHNPAPAAPATQNLSIRKGVAVVRYDPPTVRDFLGVVIHSSTTQGFTPNASNVVYKGPNSDVGLDLVEGELNFVRIAFYDVFGDVGLNYGHEMSIEVPVDTGNDFIPPGKPTNYRATAGVGFILGEWVNPSDDDLSFVELYYNTVDNISTARFGTSSRGESGIIPGLTHGQLYYTWARAVDTDGNRSDFTTVKSATPLLIDSDALKASVVTADKVAANAVTAGKIAANAVTTEKLNDLAITTAKLAANAITVAKLADGAVGAGKIAANAVTAAELAALSVNSTKLVDNAVTVAKLADGAVGAGKIAANAVTATELANLAVNIRNVAANAIETAALAANAVTAGKIAANAVTTEKLNDLAITTAKLAANAITAAKLADGAVAAGKIAANAVTATELANLAVNSRNVAANAIESAALVANAITDAKIAANAVTTEKLNDLAITTAKLAANAITAAKLADGAVAAGKIAANAVTATELANLAVNEAALADAAVSTMKLVANSVTTAKIAANAVTATQILAGSITTVKIAANAVTANQIAANAITATQISAGAVGADQIAASAIVASKLAVGDFTSFVGSPDMDDEAMWTRIGGTISFVAGNSAWASSRLMNLTGSSTCLAVSNTFKVEPGTSLYLSYRARITEGAGSVYLDIQFADNPAFTSPGYRSLPAVTSTEVTGRSGVLTTPAAKPYARVRIIKNADGVTGAYVGAVSCRRAAGGELIVDGAITAGKIAANAIAAGKIAANAVTANEIAANAISTSHLAANSVTTTQIAANAITATQILAGSITTVKLAANAVTANQIAANAVTATQIAAGAVGADQIAANAVVAKHLAVGDFENLVSNGGFEDGVNARDYWAPDANVPANTVEYVPGTLTGARTLKLTKRTNPYSDGNTRNKFPIPVRGGEVLAFETAIRSDVASTNGGYYRLIWRDNTGAGLSPLYTDLLYNVPLTTSWVVFSGKVTVPAGAATAEVYLYNTSSVTDNIYYDRLILRRANAGSLIVDGSITATQLAANAVTASKIAANSITATQLAASAVGADQIAANAIVASKLAIGDTSNVYPDFDMLDDAFYASSSTNTATFSLVRVSEAHLSARLLNISPRATVADVYSGYFTLNQSSEYMFSGVAQNYTSVGVSIELYSQGANNTLVLESTVPLLTASVAALQTASFTTGANITKGRLLFRRGAGGTLTGQFSAPTIRLKANGSLIVDGAITSAKIAANAVTANQIAANAVTATQIAANAVTANQIAANAVTATQIAANAVTATQILANSITTAKIAANAVTANQIAANAITATQISAGAVGANQIAARAITATKMIIQSLDNLVPDDAFEGGNWSNISGDISIGITDFASGAKGIIYTQPESLPTGYTAGNNSDVFPVKAGENYLLSYKSFSSGAYHIWGRVAFYDANYVALGKPNAYLPVSGTNVAAGAGERAHTYEIVAPAGATRARFYFFFQRSGLTSGQRVSIIEPRVDLKNAAQLIVNGGIIGDHIAANAITTAKIAANAITANEIAANAVTAAQILANAVTTGKVAALAITSNEIAANAVVTSKIAANAVTANQIAANAVTANQIAARSITADKLSVTSLSAISATLGNVDIGDANISRLVVGESNIAAGAISDVQLATFGEVWASDTNIYEVDVQVSHPVWGARVILTAQTLVRQDGGFAQNPTAILRIYSLHDGAAELTAVNIFPVYTPLSWSVVHYPSGRGVSTYRLSIATQQRWTGLNNNMIIAQVLKK